MEVNILEKGLIGVMLMMVKEDVAKHGIYAVMKRLKEMGFNAVEVSQIAMTPDFVSELGRACKELDMEVTSLSCYLAPVFAGSKIAGDTLAEDFDKIVQDCKTLNCTTLRTGMLPMSCMESDEAAMEFVEDCERYALRLKEHGINYYYHAHHMEMAFFNGKRLMDTMRDKTECLGFELDTHWMWRGGVDPVEYIKSFKGRIHLLHLKDYRIGKVDFDSYQVPDDKKIQYMFKEIVQYAEVGEGTLDMPNIIRTARECGTEYFLIEQDDFYGRDPFESIAISRANLVKMGFGDWFTRD